MSTEYILYARPRGNLGTEVNTYWDSVKSDKKLRHNAVIAYPPHCTLTGFFPAQQKKGKKTSLDKKYTKALIQAVASTTIPKGVTVKTKVKQEKQYDKINLSSPYLNAVTELFMKKASIPNQYKKDKYHITLRDHEFKKKWKQTKIQKLQDKINLSASASWSLFVYKKRNGGILEKVTEVKV
jgi:hypothetical protein